MRPQCYGQEWLVIVAQSNACFILKKAVG
jgi:hypothetical protein